MNDPTFLVSRSIISVECSHASADTTASRTQLTAHIWSKSVHGPAAGHSSDRQSNDLKLELRDLDEPDYEILIGFEPVGCPSLPYDFLAY